MLGGINRFSEKFAIISKKKMNRLTALLHYIYEIHFFIKKKYIFFKSTLYGCIIYYERYYFFKKLYNIFLNLHCMFRALIIKTAD